MTTDEQTFLGFDLSTQKLKGVVLNSNLEVLVYAEVKFDNDLPEYKTTGGANMGDHENEFYCSPKMWVKSIDLILDRLIVQGANFSTVACISGSGQQHGSVYWKKNGIEALKNLDADKFLHEQLNDAFSVSKSPIWMDSSTEKQCREMENAVGKDEMKRITGSKCYLRFTGPQIRKIYQTKLSEYENTERISLISSFISSIFLGDIAPIDYSDGSGMNLLDIQKKTWSEKCLNACAPNLEKKLGKPVPTCTILGNISSFFAQRYGFPINCKITASTGDNPSALCGMVFGSDWLALSLGTSDTIMMGLDQPPQLEEGHVLCHPVDDKFMGLLCFKNGSLVRDYIKRVEANNDWNNFSELLDSCPRGNNGNLAIHFHSMEIIPFAKGTLKWNSSHTKDQPNSETVSKFSSSAAEVRALIEGQIMHRKMIAADMGFNFGTHNKILATGGASVNKTILQVVSDVFNGPVYIQKTSEAALLGAGYRAAYCMYLNNLFKNTFTNGNVLDAKTTNVNYDSVGSKETYSEFVLKYISNALQRVCEPHDNSLETYDPLIKRYRDMLDILVNKSL